MTPPTLVDALTALVGPLGIVAAADAARYESDHRRLYRGTAACIVRPQSTAEVAAVVRECARRQVPVVPFGGNTSYCGGASVDTASGAVLISLERLRAVRAADPLGNTLTVEAGCTLAQVRAAATAIERQFPLSLGSEGSCQIGGNLSTNAGGTQVLRHGMARALVLGLEVVLPDGRVLDQLRGLYKDNTGYDVKQLFIGAEGTLGIITAAVLRVLPVSADSLTALVAVDGLAAAVDLLARLRDAFGDLVETYEYMPAAAVGLARQVFPQIADPFDAPYGALVLVELPLPAALAGLRDTFEEWLARAAESGHLRDAAIARSLSQAEAFWFLRENIPAAQTRAGASLKHDVSLPLAQLAAFEARGLALMRQFVPQGRPITYGHAGDGNLHFNLSVPAGVTPGSEAEQAFLAQREPLMRAIHDLVAEFGGSFSAEHGIGRLKTGELARYEDPVALQLMRQLKTALDPLGLMNPGKVLAPP